MNEDLRKWFGKGKEGDWVRVGTDGEIKGDCAREPGEGKPKCMPRSKAHSMGKDDRATAARRKRREDPVADRKGKGNKPVMVNTEEFMMEGNEPTNPSLWSKAKSLAKQKFDVYPSAYANGWAAKYYKSKGGGWKSVSEEAVDEACWDGYKRVGMKKKGKRMVPNCVPEATDIIAKAKAAVAKKAGSKLKLDPDTGTPDHFTAAQRRKKGLDEAGSKQHIEVTHTTGQKSKKPVHPDNAFKALNHYRSLSTTKSARIVSEEDSKKYPRKGFPEPGDYGYHPNPGLKPQESDKDEDMDVAYKKATEKEGRKPLNAKITEALTRVTSGNKGYGYHGTVEARDDAEKDKRYSAMHRYAKKLVGDAGHLQDAKKPNVMVKHFLDSAHGRHIADNPTDKNITSRFSEFKKKYDPAMHEEVELEEAYGMWKVDFPKQHAGKPVAAGSVHVKAQNTAHAHKVAAKRVGVDHKAFKSKVTKSSVLPEDVDSFADALIKRNKQNLNKGHVVNAARIAGMDGKKLMSAVNKKVGRIKEEVEQVDEYNNYRKAGKDPFAARKQYIAMDRAEKKGVMPGSSTSTADAIAAFKAKGGKPKKFDTKGNVKEELGKSNEWGRPELRKKFAAMTPGQESMAADKIPTFDPRYDDVTTQYCGGIKEGYLAEISAKGSMARDDFKKKLQRALVDPKNIARAKKVLAKRKEAEKAKEAPHLVMQLRKAVSIGSKVHFQDGQHHTIAPNHADIFMSKYNSAKSSIEKEALQKRAHKSHAEFMKTIAEGVHENCGTPDCCQMCDTAEMGTHHVDSYEAHKGSGDQISPVISHDDEDIRFQDFDEEAFEKELEADVLALSWDDLVDLYDEDEIEYDETPEKEDEGEDLEEGITPAGRLKKKFNAMRTKSRRMMARNIAIKRVSTPEKLKSRSVRAARRMVYKRLLRNRDISTVSSAEKTRLEAQIKRMAPMVARLSVRVMPAVRKLEQSRIKNSRTRKKK